MLKPAVPLAQKDIMMMVLTLIVLYVQINMVPTVLFVMKIHVLNVVKTEKHQDVTVLLDMLKSMENVNLVTTIVKHVPLPPLLVPNVLNQESNKKDLLSIVYAQMVSSKKPKESLTVPNVTGDVKPVQVHLLTVTNVAALLETQFQIVHAKMDIPIVVPPLKKLNVYLVVTLVTLVYQIQMIVESAKNQELTNQTVFVQLECMKTSP